MSMTVNIQTWLTRADSIAASVHGETIFGVFKRTFDLPSGFACKSTSREGVERLHKPGAVVDGSEVSELLVYRTHSIDLSLEVAKLTSQDRYLCDGGVQLRVSLVPEIAELNSFRDRVIASRSDANLETLVACLRPGIEKGLRDFVSRHDSSALVGGKVDEAAGAAIEDSVAEVCFSSGLTVDAVTEVRFNSEGYAKVRVAEAHAARRLEEHAAQSGLREAIKTAQNEKLDHLQSMLSRLQELADASPDADMSNLMKAFSESQRGQLYQALFESQATRRVTESVVVVTGGEVLRFDSNSLSNPPQRIPVDGAAGRLRSLQLGPSNADSAPNLFIGASTGVYEFDPEQGRVVRTYVFDADAAPRGGFNAVGVDERWVVGSHSELGVIVWHRDQKSAPSRFLEYVTGNAQAVRCAQFGSGRFWCAIDDGIYSVPATNLTGEPVRLDAGIGVVTSLTIEGDSIFAGTVNGEVLHWTDLTASNPTTIHAGSRRAVESISSISGGDVDRLFYTDTSLAVFSRVLGDSFVCRYEAGGQTIRRAACASDVIAATNDARDRLIVWNARQPKHPAQVVSIAQLTGRSAQDVGLVPLA